MFLGVLKVRLKKKKNSSKEVKNRPISIYWNVSLAMNNIYFFVLFLVLKYESDE